jgi:parallel beta-helix repeat protein
MRMRRIVFWMMFASLLLGTLALVFNVGLVRAQAETVYIRGDGSVSPSSAPISSPDDVNYTFTGDMSYPAYYGIVVERSNIVIDGNGYTVRTVDQSGDGLDLTGAGNVTIKDINIQGFFHGIYLNSSSNNILSRNTVTQADFGIYLNNSPYNTVSGNTATANTDGLFLLNSSNNIVCGNNSTANQWGIVVRDSSNNTVCGNNVKTNSVCGIFLPMGSSNNTMYHNNFVENGGQASLDAMSVGNTWDNGYPSGGNYWSDYNGTDLRSGQYQNVTGSDGIGDTPYAIDADNTDSFPLMGVSSEFNVAKGDDVQVVSNSTVSDFKFNGTAILFNVSGPNGSTGFCNAQVPTSVLNGTLTIFVNGTQVQYSILPSSNSSISYLYFTYGHPTEQIIIVQEFPEPLILVTFMLATLLAIAIYKERHIHASLCMC